MSEIEQGHFDEEGLTIQERIAKERQLAIALGAFASEWVVVKNSAVQGYGKTLGDVINLGLDGRIFMVPEESDGASFYLNAA